MAQNLGIPISFSQARTPYHAETADVRPCLPKVCTPMELDERRGSVQVRRLELIVVSQEVVRQLELWRSPMPMSCWMKHVGLLVRCPPLSLTPLHSSASEALPVHSPRISSAHIWMDGMTDMMRFDALVADMMTVDQVDERIDSEVVGGGCHRGRAISTVSSSASSRIRRGELRARRFWRSTRWAPSQRSVHGRSCRASRR